MKNLTRRAALGAAAGVVLARAGRAQQATIAVVQPWSRAAGAGAVGAGFMTLRNTGSTPDRLIAARSTAAGTVELHTHVRDGDVMRMRPVEAIDLPPGQDVRLAPGGYHLMLIGLTAATRPGTTLPVTLVFERAGEVTVNLAVERAGARGPSAAAGSHHQH